MLIFIWLVLSRRSGLHDAMTASELRRLTDKFKKKGSGGETAFDYEK